MTQRDVSALSADGRFGGVEAIHNHGPKGRK